MVDHGLLAPAVAGTAAEAMTSDAALVEDMLRFESALAAALADTGLVSDDAAAAVAEACAVLEPDDAHVRDLALRAAAGGNPVIPLVADLRDRVAATRPDAAAAVHHGATSQDVLDSALMLASRRALGQLATDLRVAATQCARLAEEHRDTVCCGRTLGMQAQPTTFGFRAAGWLAGLDDAVRRVEATAAALPVQLGGPVGTGAAYGGRGPEVVEALAARLGLAAPVACWHTRRTPVVDVGHALVASAGVTGKVAADVVVLSQSEVGEVTEPSGGPSSSMPHKANPARSVLVTAAARQVPALVAVLGASAVAEQERPAGAWHAEWEPLRQALRLAGAAAARCAGVLAGLRVHPEAMRAHVEDLRAHAGIDERELAAACAAARLWVDRVVAGHRKAAP